MTHYHWLLLWLALAVGCLAVPLVLALPPLWTRVLHGIGLALAVVVGILALTGW